MPHGGGDRTPPALIGLSPLPRLMHGCHGRYKPGLTVFSFFAAVIFVYLGLDVASRDRFFGQDRDARVSTLLQGMRKQQLRAIQSRGKWLVELEALYQGLHWLVAGGVLAAVGIGVMHYSGEWMGALGPVLIMVMV
jgi:NO-binding membrane sensor protein with MHYT domain